MQHDEFRSLIEKSAPTDWRTIPGAGPTYRVRYGSISTAEGVHRVDINEHHSVVVFTPDIDITIAFGMGFDFDYADVDRRPKRSFDWMENFADDHIDICFADLFYRGSLVDRINYVSVDGARAILPWAREYDGLKADRFDTAVARLLHAKAGHSADFDEYFHRAGFVVE
ncbi:hypothetical protein [Nocardia grenadensis]